MTVLVHVRGQNGARCTLVHPSLESACDRLPSVLRAGGTVLTIVVDGHRLTRWELVTVGESVAKRIPRPIPAYVAGALLRLLPWAG